MRRQLPPRLASLLFISICLAPTGFCRATPLAGQGAAPVISLAQWTEQCRWVRNRRGVEERKCQPMWIGPDHIDRNRRHAPDGHHYEQNDQRGEFSAPDSRGEAGARERAGGDGAGMRVGPERAPPGAERGFGARDAAPRGLGH